MRIFLLFIIATSLAMESPAQDYRTLEIKSRSPLPESARPGVTQPGTPVYRLLEDGRPLLSEAGFVQLADEGPGFYYGSLTKDRVEWTRSIGMIGTNNWGAPSAMVLVSQVVATWHGRHPDIRLGIVEISSRFGGFPDYDHDGISDHLTHQAGMNVNFLLPCRQQPEVTIHVGSKRDDNHAELHDPQLFGELIDIIVATGAWAMTTNARLGLFDDADRKAQWTEVGRDDDGYGVHYEHRNQITRIYLLNPQGDHGDHVNVLAWRGN